jgi:hypothetical protein
MPRFDGTGPQGKGPKTGRGMGDCNGDKPKSTDFGRGRGLGRGFGQGRGANQPQEKDEQNS